MAIVDISRGQVPTNQDDVITGTARNDAIAARAGNDLVTAGGGNDAVDGGPGTDTAAYSGAFADYRVTANRGPGEWAVQDLRGGRPDGSDALANVERLRFADRTVLLQDDAGPVGAADTAAMDEDGAAILIDVLANDRDADGDPLAITGFRDVVGGTVSVVGGKAQFVPAANFSGTASFTYTAKEDLGALPAYTLQGAPVAPKATEASVAITVQAVNDAPVNTVPGAQTTNQGAALTINGLGVGDVDAGANPLKVTLGVGHGTLDLSGIAGLTFASGDGAGDAAMTFTGTIASINTALTGLKYAPAGGFSGPDALTITTNDQGYTGLGGAFSDTDIVPITVIQASSGTHHDLTTSVGGTVLGWLFPSGPYPTFTASGTAQLFFSPAVGFDNDWRGVLEFSTSSVTRSVEAATLIFTPEIYEGATLPAGFDVYAYAGNGSLETGDYDLGVLLGHGTLAQGDVAAETYAVSLDPGVVNTAVGQSTGWVGLNLRVSDHTTRVDAFHFEVRSAHLDLVF